MKQAMVIFTKFIPKIRAGARILTRVQSPKAQHFVCEYLFVMFDDSWVVFSHIYLLQIEKISISWPFIAIYT